MTRPLRFPADPGAGLDVVIDRFAESRSRFVDSIGVEADTVADSGDPPGERTVFFIVFDTGRVSFVGRPVRHGAIPILPGIPAGNHIDPFSPIDRL